MSNLEITDERIVMGNRQAILEGTALIDALIPIRRARLRGDDESASAAKVAEWQTQRADWLRRMEEAAAAGSSLRLLEVRDGFSLTDAELDILLLSLAPRVDPDFLDRLGRAHETFFFRGVDVDLTLGLLFHTPADRLSAHSLLSPEGRLISGGLITVTAIESRLNPHEAEVRPSEAIANFILERPSITGALARYCELAQPKHSWDQVILPAEQKVLVWQIVSGEPIVRANLSRWGYDEVLSQGRGATLLFAGPPGTGKTALAHAIAERIGARLLILRASRLVAAQQEIHSVISDALRAAQLERAVVLIDDCETLLSIRDARLLAMLEALEVNEGLVILTTNLAPQIDMAMHRRIQFRLDFEAPRALLREQIWEVHLPAEAPLASDIDIPTLAATYEFTGAAIRNTVLVALSRMAALGRDVLEMSHLRDAAETQLGARFDDLAVRTTGPAGLERLVLPQTEAEKLREVVDACRFHDDVLTRWGFGRRLSKGRGICVLFDGPPGTGKTFTAELLSHELRLPLYRIHIPNIVSKWVGETERNISELFVRARGARAMLLFDEADSLFGRRSTQSQGANDRYANMEVNLLLQEIERYDGITVLTTNLFGNLDEALQRRIQFRITFPFPKPAERGRIWKMLMPPEAPLGDDVDFAALGSRFELSGGHIKNALLRGAYRARATGGVIQQAHLAAAALRECEAQGKLVRRKQPPGRRTAPTATANPPSEAPE